MKNFYWILFSFQCQDQEENALLLLIWRLEEVLSGGAKIHTGKLIFCKLLFTNLFPQATDESEASEEEVENQLRKMDRVWTAHCACAMLLTTSRLFIFWSGFFPINKNLYLLLCNKRERNVPILYTFSVWLSIKTGVLLF